jgi:hypothetical protein
VIGRIFLYQPRAATQVEALPESRPEPAAKASVPVQNNDKKRKRHRH